MIHATMPRFGKGNAFTELVLDTPSEWALRAGAAVACTSRIPDADILRVQLAHLEILDPDAWQIERILVGMKLVALPPMDRPQRTRTIAFAWRPIDLWCHQTLEIKAMPLVDTGRFHARFVGTFERADHP